MSDSETHFNSEGIHVCIKFRGNHKSVLEPEHHSIHEAYNMRSHLSDASSIKEKMKWWYGM